MHAPSKNTAASRSGTRRLVAPWEYRHLCVLARVRAAAGIFAVSRP